MHTTVVPSLAPTLVADTMSSAPTSREEKLKLIAASMSYIVTETLISVSRCANRDTEKVRQKRQLASSRLTKYAKCTEQHIDAHITCMMGRCDVCFRASDSTNPAVTKWKHLLYEASNCRVHEDPTEEYAGDVVGDLSVEQSLFTQYGSRGEMDYEQKRVRELFSVAFKMRISLINSVQRHKMLVKESRRSTTEYPYTTSEAMRNLRTNLTTPGKVPEMISNLFVGVAVRTYTALQEAEQELAKLKLRVENHVNARVKSGVCYFSHAFIGVDLVASIAEFAGYKSAPALLCLQRGFAVDDNIKKICPHISIRCVKGLFPHIEGGFDGFGQHVVCKSNQVHVVVDLAVTGKVVDGSTHSTLVHRSSSSGWESAEHEGHDVRVAKLADYMQRRYRNYDEEVVPEDRFRVRLGAKLFFEDELDCKVELVYAGSHNSVSNMKETGLLCPRRMAVRQTRLTTYTAKDLVPYPAYSAYNVLALTKDKQKQLYQFKVTAYGRTRGTATHASYDVTLTSFSVPFAVVATKRSLKRKSSSR